MTYSEVLWKKELLVTTKILTTDFAALTDDLQEIFNETAKSTLADMVGMQVFKVQDTDRRTYDYLTVHGLDVIQLVAQGSDLPEATAVQGRIKDFFRNLFTSFKVLPCLNSF